MKEGFAIITNNPLVLKEMKAGHNIMYKETSYEGLLLEVRALIHKGYRLLTHPLSGSVKPKETPYKSVLVSNGSFKRVDADSLKLIEGAIETCRKFEDKTGRYSEEVLKDFELIDMDLIKGAIASAYI